MNDRKAKLAAVATVLGLGALGGVALGTNPGQSPATAQQPPGNSARIVTSTSGATSTVSQPAAVRASGTTRAPIVTGASGASSVAAGTSDD